jgi:hypothetical protein
MMTCGPKPSLILQSCTADLPTVPPKHFDHNQLVAHHYLLRPSYATLTLVTEY